MNSVLYFNPSVFVFFFFFFYILYLNWKFCRHIEGNSHLVIIKNAGHPVNLEKPELFYKHLKAFLTNSPPQVYKEED